MKTIGKSVAMSAVVVCALSSTAIEAHAEQPVAIGVVTKTLNIRTGPSSKNSLVIKAPVGDEVEIMNKENSKGWAKVKYKSKEGWAYMPNVKEKKLSSPTRYISGVHRVPLREKPTSKSECFGYVYEGDKVEVIDYKGSYARVKFKGKVYYMLKDYFSTKNPAQVKYIAGVWRKVLKSGYVSTSKELGYIMEGSEITVVGYRNGYAHIIYDGKRYYIKNTNLVSKNPVKYKYVTDEEKIPVTYGDSKVVGYIGKGQKIKTFGVKDGETRISFNGQTGFIKGTSSLGDYPTKVVSGADSVKVYQSMSEKNEIGVVPEGMNVLILAENENWVKIKYGTGEGYIKSSYIKDIKYVESSKALDVKKKSSSDSSTVCTVESGSLVEVLGYSNGWAKIKYNNYVGYIENQYLVMSKSGSNETFISGLKADSANDELRYTTKENVSVYKNPLVDDSIHGYLVKGSAVEFISHLNNEFTKVKVNDSVVGYVKRNSLSHRNKEVKNTTSSTVKNISMTHSEFVSTQKSSQYTNYNDMVYYSNPLNFSLSNDDEKFQFLKLNTYREVNAYDLNVYLSNIKVNPGNEAIFKGQASAFISAAKKYNIDPIYLVAHTLLETGYGNSKLAQGVVVTEDAAGNKVTPTKVHNLFGIGAIDSDAIGGGSKTAYALGWTSIPKAIEGAAKWISQGVAANASVGLKKSDGYIHSTKFTHQYTLYAMRYSYVKDYSWHQYATDPKWCFKISRLMNELSYIYEGAKLVFEVPKYAQEKYVVNEEVMVVDDLEVTEELDKKDELESQYQATDTEDSFNENTEDVEVDSVLENAPESNVQEENISETIEEESEVLDSVSNEIDVAS